MATLTGYGLHELVWETADEWVGDVFVASPADAEGRGIALTVKRNGTAADLTGASVYFLWRHRESLARGTTLFDEVDASAGAFQVYYPAAMAGHEGTVDAQVMVSESGECISTRTFQIRVEPVLVGDTDSDDGFTLFVEAIQAYENAGSIATDAAIAANEAAQAALQAAADLRAAAESGAFNGADGFDGTDGMDGEDGVSPTVSVETTSRGHRITVTDESGPHSFDVVDGKDGVSPTAQVEQTSTGARITVTDGSGTTTATLAHGPKGDKGDQGLRGATGAPGADGVSCTHAWSGSVLTISSASGVSSADLAGPQGPTGARGPQGPVGPAGADGDDYVLTSQDKSDIAALVAAMFTNGDTTGY